MTKKIYYLKYIIPKFDYKINDTGIYGYLGYLKTVIKIKRNKKGYFFMLKYSF